MKLIFLDIDGVLNSSAWFKCFFKQNQVIVSVPDDKLDPDAIARLNKITDATGAKIVISSTWRMLFRSKFPELIEILKEHGVTGDIIGMTPILGTVRGKEIKSWLYTNTEYDVEKFIIIDDDSDMDTLRDNHLIKTTFEFGLQDEHVSWAIKWLS